MSRCTILGLTLSGVPETRLKLNYVINFFLLIAADISRKKLFEDWIIDFEL